MRFQPTRLATALLGATLISLAGCGGGSSDSSTATSTSTTFVGTAAAGLPLVGTVTVKDATGATKTVAIGTNGSYSVDVSGMTAPFVFRAEGSAGGTTYVLHSAATAADANGNINITPLTDLVVANIAGNLAANYFNSGNFSNLTAQELKSETDGLRDKLLPVLQAMGVDAAIDLLRAQFTPLSSALDKALDVISISVDPATNVATITNLVNDISITDSITTPAASETPTTLAADNMTTAADDVTLVRQAVSNFFALYANGLPTPAAVEAQLFGGTGANTADATTLPFRNDDLNATQFANALASESSLVGATISDIVIHKLDYTTTSIKADVFPRAFVGFTIKDQNGIIIDRVKSIQIAKGGDNVWRLRGNGFRLAVDAHSHIVKDAGNDCRYTGLEFDISDPNPGNDGQAAGNPSPIAYVMVTGPGLPSGGLKYVPPSLAGDYWSIDGMPGWRYYVLASSCNGTPTAGATDTEIAAIPAKAAYNVEAYLIDDTVAQAGGVDISYNDFVPYRPLTVAEMATAAFPVITAPAPASFAGYTGGDLTISASNMNPAAYNWLYLGLDDGSNFDSIEEDVAASAGGLISRTLTLGSMPSATTREIRVETTDSTNLRRLMTVLKP